MLNKLSLDLLANLASLAFLAAAGIALNITIGRYYGPADLGLFNVVFAMFIFASQFGSAGLQYSTLRFASLKQSSAETRAVLLSALRIVLTTASATVAVAAVATPAVAAVFDMAGLGRAWLLALPGLWCFCVNKVLLAFLNGVGAMRAFAFYQSLRYLLMVAALFLAMRSGFPGTDLAVILSISEAFLLISLVPQLISLLRSSPRSPIRSNVWHAAHLRFGILAMPSGVIAELNTRVDVLLLGALLGSYQTGVYSIALLLVEGFAQIVFVVRNVVNPLLGPLVERRDQAALTNLVRIAGGATLGLMVVGGVLLLAVFPVLDRLLLLGRFGEAFWPLVILVSGLTMAGPHLAFSMVLSQGGRPAIYTMLMTSILVSNVVFNLIGVYTYGIIGAAIGTALSYVLGVVTLQVLCRRVFHLSLSPF